MDPEHTPRRRRGLPRTVDEAAEQTPAAESAETSPQAPAEPTPTSQASSEPPARRTGMSQSPQQPDSAPPPQAPEQSAQASQPPARRRTGMGKEPEQPAPHRTGMSQQPAQQSQQPARRAPMGQASEPAARRSGLGTQAPSQAPAQEKPAPTPAEAKAGAAEYTAPKPAKTQPAQKTFLNRTGGQWALQGGIGVVILIVVAAAMVLLTRWLLGTEPAADFLESYPGQYSQPDAPGGYPPWLNWAHFFNAFLMVLVIKTGIQIRTESRPAAYWTPKWNKKRKISLTIWMHNALDLLWVLNGLAFVLLLIITGYWQRVVPTSWDVFPNALSAALQYVSLDWPTAGEWAHYNSLQELAYFTTIFIAAPLAILTGVRMSGLWPAQNNTLNKLLPVEWARAVHFPVMIYFTVFILVHLILVLATDALSNLNQIYTGDDAQNWTGFWLFVLSLAVMVAGAFLARALFVAPIASLFGRVGR